MPGDSIVLVWVILKAERSRLKRVEEGRGRGTETERPNFRDLVVTRICPILDVSAAEYGEGYKEEAAGGFQQLSGV